MNIPDKYKGKLKFLLFIVILSLLWLMGNFFHIDTEGIRRSLAHLPVFHRGILFILLYVIVSFFIWFSKDIFWVVGAVLFGAYTSALLVWIAEIINAFILFHLAHFLGRDFIKHYLSERYNKFDEKIGCFGFPWFFLLRAVPLIPYRFLDLGAGLTCLSFGRYLAAVIIGSPLKIFWVQYILAGVGESVFNNPAKLVEYFLSNRLLFNLSLIYLLLIGVIIWRLKVKFKG